MCQNWQISSIAKIGKYHQLSKLANFSDTQSAKIGVCRHWRGALIRVPTSATALLGEGCAGRLLSALVSMVGHIKEISVDQDCPPR